VLAESLAALGKGGVQPTPAPGQVEAWVAFVAKYRAAGRTQYVLRLLLPMRAALPTDPRVHYCLGEAFGVLSHALDCARADAAFADVEALLPHAPAGAEGTADPVQVLATFLTEVAGLGDPAAGLRLALLRFRERLAAKKAISRWRCANRGSPRSSRTSRSQGRAASRPRSSSGSATCSRSTRTARSITSRSAKRSGRSARRSRRTRRASTCSGSSISPARRCSSSDGTARRSSTATSWPISSRRSRC
jgi:hypothetical protein